MIKKPIPPQVSKKKKPITKSLNISKKTTTEVIRPKAINTKLLLSKPSSTSLQVLPKPTMPVKKKSTQKVIPITHKEKVLPKTSVKLISIKGKTLPKVTSISKTTKTKPTVVQTTICKALPKITIEKKIKAIVKSKTVKEAKPLVLPKKIMSTTRHKALNTQGITLKSKTLKDTTALVLPKKVIPKSIKSITPTSNINASSLMNNTVITSTTKPKHMPISTNKKSVSKLKATTPIPKPTIPILDVLEENTKPVLRDEIQPTSLNEVDYLIQLRERLPMLQDSFIIIDYTIKDIINLRTKILGQVGDKFPTYTKDFIETSSNEVNLFLLWLQNIDLAEQYATENRTSLKQFFMIMLHFVNDDYTKDSVIDMNSNIYQDYTKLNIKL